MHIIFRILSTAAFLSSSLSFAQTPDTATLRGHVDDQTHSSIAGASITVTNALTGISRKIVTDKTGSFYIGGLPVDGSYSAIAEKEGFSPAHADHIFLSGGSTADIELSLGVAGTQAVVTVTGTVESLRTDQPQTGILLTASQIADTPLYGSKITFLPLLNAANRPAINQGDIFMNQDLFTTNGAGRRQTWFEIDGGNGIDSWGRQTIFTNIPVAAVQEMSVLTNAFSAEYGGSTGSVVNIITKSGGNYYHGHLFELWRPSGPEAALSGFTTKNAASGNDITNDTLGQSAASIGGPLSVSRHTYFFAAAEFSRQNRASPVVSALFTGPYNGHYREWLGNLRLDHQISTSNNAFLRTNIDGFYDTNPNGIVGGASLPNVARVFHKKTYALEAGDTAIITTNLLNSLRLQFQLASPITEFDPVTYSTQYVVPIVNGATTGTFTSGTSQSALLMNRQYELSDTLTSTYRRNQLSVGADVIYAHTGGNSKEFGGPIYLGSFSYNPCTVTPSVTVTDCETTFVQNIANVKTYTQSFGNAAYTVDDVIWAAFAQDELHLKNLTFNLGIRYERQTFTDSTKLFAPRIGFVYNPANNSRIIVRGGFGIYDSQIVDNSEANYALTGPTGVFSFSAAPGQVGFPSSVAAAPLTSFPVGGAVPLRSLYIRPGDGAYLNSFFPTSTLINYPNKLVNPYSEQYTFGIEQQLAPGWTLSVDYVGTHTLRITRPLDVDAPSSYIRTSNTQPVRTAQAANCTRPYWIYWYASHGTTCSVTTNAGAPPYSVIQSDSPDGVLYYNALDVNLNHTLSHGFSMLASYTYSHAIDNVDPDTTAQNPNDPLLTGRQEIGNAIFDQRHRFVLSGVYVAPLKMRVGGVATLASGLPYNIVTGATNSGDTGATTDRPIINGAVLGRNTGRGRPLYDAAPFVSRSFALFHERIHVEGRAEAFNVLNHANFVGYNGTYGTGATASPSLGTPLVGVTAQLPARSLQFSAKLTF